MDAVTTSRAVDSEAMPRPPTDTVSVTFRIPRSIALEADEAADLLSTTGDRKSRTDAFREALARGLASIRAEHGVTADADTEAPRKAPKKRAPTDR